MPQTNTNEWEKEFDDLRFASCPTEEKEPFFWWWTEEGKETIKFFISDLLSRHDKERTAEVVEKIEKEIAIYGETADKFDTAIGEDRLIEPYKNKGEMEQVIHDCLVRVEFGDKILTTLRSPEGGEEKTTFPYGVDLRKTFLEGKGRVDITDFEVKDFKKQVISDLEKEGEWPTEEDKEIPEIENQ